MENEGNEEFDEDVEGSDEEGSFEEESFEHEEPVVEERGSLQSQIEQYEMTIKMAYKAKPKNIAEAANALNDLGIVNYKVGRFKEAMNCQERQLELAKLLKDHRTERRALCNLGCAAKNAKDYDLALDCFQKGLEMVTAEGDKRGEGKFLNNLASAYESLADFDNAIKYYDMRLALAKSLKDTVGETKCCASIANVLHVKGDIRESIKYFERVVVCIKLKMASEKQEATKSQDGSSQKELTSDRGSQFSS